MPDIRFVVVHTPGPNWKPDVPTFEQPGLQAHVEHYRRLLEAGKMSLGGPFIDGRAGGMMIPEAGVTAEEVQAFAADDPAVRSGLLAFEVRAWMVAMRK